MCRFPPATRRASLSRNPMSMGCAASCRHGPRRMSRWAKVMARSSNASTRASSMLTTGGNRNHCWSRSDHSGENSTTWDVVDLRRPFPVIPVRRALRWGRGTAVRSGAVRRVRGGARGPGAAIDVATGGEQGWAARDVLEYKWQYLDGDLVGWSVDDIEALLFEIFPAKVTLGPHDSAAVIAGFAAFLRFLSHERSCPKGPESVWPSGSKRRRRRSRRP